MDGGEFFPINPIKAQLESRNQIELFRVADAFADGIKSRRYSVREIPGLYIPMDNMGTINGLGPLLGIAAGHDRGVYNRRVTCGGSDVLQEVTPDNIQQVLNFPLDTIHFSRLDMSRVPTPKNVFTISASSESPEAKIELAYLREELERRRDFAGKEAIILLSEVCR